MADMVMPLQGITVLGLCMRDWQWEERRMREGTGYAQRMNKCKSRKVGFKIKM